MPGGRIGAPEPPGHPGGVRRARHVDMELRMKIETKDLAGSKIKTEQKDAGRLTAEGYVAFMMGANPVTGAQTSAPSHIDVCEQISNPSEAAATRPAARNVRPEDAPPAAK